MKKNYTLYIRAVILLFSFLTFFKTNAQCKPFVMENWNNFGISNFTITGDAASTINNNSVVEDTFVMCRNRGLGKFFRWVKKDVK